VDGGDLVSVAEALIRAAFATVKPRVFYVPAPQPGSITPPGVPYRAGWYVADPRAMENVGPYPTLVEAFAYARGLATEVAA
jgi:hypothetical protein